MGKINVGRVFLGGIVAGAFSWAVQAGEAAALRREFYFFASFFFTRALTSILMSEMGSFLFRGRRTVAWAVS